MIEHRSEWKDPAAEERVNHFRRNTCLVAESTRRGQLLSREEAGDKVGVGPRTIRSWEDGTRGMEVAELIYMAESYGTDPVKMFIQIAQGEIQIVDGKPEVVQKKK
jgi:hypothetical protein